MRLGNQNKACYNNHGYKNRNAIEKPFQSTIEIPDIYIYSLWMLGRG